MGRTLTLADGQLAAAATEIFDGENGPPTGHVAVTFSNTGTVAETIVLTFQRAAGTARRLLRFVLDANEQAIVSGLPMQPDDSLLGYTTTASVVDYLVFSAPPGGLQLTILNADGNVKTSPAILEQISALIN